MSKAKEAAPVEVVETPDDIILVRVTTASADPVKLTINDEPFVLRVGVATAVPRWVLGALSDSDAQFEVM